MSSIKTKGLHQAPHMRADLRSADSYYSAGMSRCSSPQRQGDASVMDPSPSATFREGFRARYLCTPPVSGAARKWIIFTVHPSDILQERSLLCACSTYINGGWRIYKIRTKINQIYEFGVCETSFHPRTECSIVLTCPPTCVSMRSLTFQPTPTPAEIASPARSRWLMMETSLFDRSGTVGDGGSRLLWSAN